MDAKDKKVQVDCYSCLQDLPTDYESLLEQAGRRNFFLSKAWFENFAANAVDAGHSLAIYGLRVTWPEPRALALIIGRAEVSTNRFLRPRSFAGLTNFYSMDFAPLVGEAVAKPGMVLRDLFAAMGADSYDVMHLGPLDPDAPMYAELGASLRQAGFLVAPSFQFANWYEPIGPKSFEDYMQTRPSILRNTLRRRAKQLAKTAKARFEVVTGGAALEGAIRDYETIYAASWKEPESYPAFISGLIRASARTDCLRLGLLYVDDVPAAAQIWIVSGKRATIYKLAYDPRFKSLSVGSLLTEHLMKRVIDGDRVEEVDYGSGDDAYKREWMSQRRERRQLTAYNVRTPRGLLLGAVRRGVGALRAVHGRIPGMSRTESGQDRQ